MNIDKKLEDVSSEAWSAARSAAESAAYSAAYSEERKKQLEMIKEYL